MLPSKRCWVKIRLTSEQAKALRDLVFCLKESGAEDALFVYARMCFDNAFEYVLSELPAGLEVKFCRQEYVGNLTPYIKDEGSAIASLKSLLENDVNHLGTVDDIYTEMLNSFKGTYFMQQSHLCVVDLITFVVSQFERDTDQSQCRRENND